MVQLFPTPLYPSLYTIRVPLTCNAWTARARTDSGYKHLNFDRMVRAGLKAPCEPAHIYKTV